MKNQSRYRVLILSVLLTIVFSGFPVTAQQERSWSAPEVIVEAEGSVATDSYAFFADRMGGLHLFYRHKIETGVESIDYLHWNNRQGWSEPVELISRNTIFDVRATLDADGIIHLVWVSNAGLEYAAAPVTQAESVRSWSAPEVLANATGDFDIHWSSQGLLFIGYVDRSSRAIVLISSQDSGLSWTTPAVVAFSSDSSVMPDQVRLAADERGRLHTVWSEYELPDGWPPTGVYYARSEDNGESWSVPLTVYAGSYAQIGVGAVGQDQVHLVWRSTIGGDGTFYQWSQDGGDTWSPIEQTADRGGLSGLPSFAVDNDGIVHHVIGPVKYAYWEQGRLSEYEDVAWQQRLIQTQSVERGAIAITSGNHLHIIFELDFKSLWHTSMILPAPESEPVPYVGLLEPAPTITPEVQELTRPTAVSAYTPQWKTTDNPSQMISNLGLVSGFLLPLLLVMGVVVIHLLRKQR